MDANAFCEFGGGSGHVIFSCAFGAEQGMLAFCLHARQAPLKVQSLVFHAYSRPPLIYLDIRVDLQGKSSLTEWDYLRRK